MPDSTVDEVLAQSVRYRRGKKVTLGVMVVSIVMLLAALGLSILAIVKRDDLASWELRGQAVSTLARSFDESLVEANSDITEIDSSLGFNVAFDKKMFEVFAQTTDLKSTPSYIFGESFEGDELNETRDYSIVKLKPVSPSEDEELFSLTPELAISTNIRDTFWETQRAKAGNADKEKIDMLVAYLIESDSSEDSQTTTELFDVTIGSYDYKKIVTSTSNEKYGIATPSRQVTYATIQNDRPYWSTINYTREPSSELAQFEAVVKDIIYPKPTSATLSQSTTDQPDDDAVSMTETTAGPFTLPDRTSYVPNDLDDETLVRVVARNQPAVVRVLTMRCGDYRLSSGDASLEFDNICTYGIGSGSIITSDGYILTNGHVASIAEKDVLDYGIFSTRGNLDALLEYLAASGDITETEREALTNGLNRRDQGAISALMNITDFIDKDEISIENDDYTYAIQLSTEPLRVNTPQRDARLTPNFGDTIVEASFIDMNYSDENSIDALDESGGASASDVAILKMEGTYPAVRLGSIDDIKIGNRLTAIGYPAFVDGGVQTKQSKTVPSVTQGKVMRVYGDGSANDYQLINTTVPIAQGNSGGPSFNDKGLQVGVNTYAYFNCADLNCFGSGVVRDIEDAKALLLKNRIQVKDDADLTRDWYGALDSYELGNYKEAVRDLERIEREYPANYLARPLVASAQAALGGETDRSSDFEQVDMMQVTVWVLIGVGGGLLVTSAVVMVRLRRAAKRRAVLTPPSSPTTPNTPPNAV